MMGQDMKLAFLGKKIQERLILVGKQLQQNPNVCIAYGKLSTCI